MNGLLEILTNKKWMMHPESLQALRMVIQQNLTGHVALEQFHKQTAYCMGMTADGASIQMSMPGERVEQEAEAEVQQYVAILPVCGPITRNGDACSYGSIDLRDAVLSVASEEECKGIVFYINSPGGSAAAIADYKYAIDFARENGKKCTAFVDGFCGSAAFYLAALCDERYYMNEQDQIGSIGTMAAFYTEKSGEKNQYTNETYHELYADQSYEKNKWHRDAAEGDYTDLLEDLNRTNEQFMADVKAACPNATDEHLHGRVFDAKDVDGILMDGQSTLGEIVNGIIALDTEGNTEEGCKPKKCETTYSNIDMNNYPLINAACGLQAGEMVVTEEGTHMDATLLDAVEARLAETEQLSAKVADIENQLKEAQDAKAQAEKALADAQEAHSVELAAKAEEIDAKAKEIEAKAQEVESLNSQLSTLNSDLAGVKESLATAEQTIADRDAQIAALSEETGNEPDGGESPENNGEGAKVKTMREFHRDPSKSNAENKAAYQRFMRGEE